MILLRTTIPVLLVFAITAPVVASDAEMRAAFQRGNQLKDAGKYEDAEKEYQKSLDFALDLYGEENKTTAIVLNALARLYHDARRFEDAVRIHARSLKVREKIAPGTQDEAIARSGLGLALEELGQYAEAETHLARALKLRAAGTDQIAVAQDATNLGILYRTLGRYPEAEDLQRTALKILDKEAPGHPFAAMVRNNLANLFLDQGKYADAETLYQKALDDLRKAHGPDHPLVGSALHNLGLVNRRRGRYAEAERLAREALAVFEKMPGKTAVPVSDALTHLGNLYYEQGKYADAESAHRRALKLREENVPGGPLLVAASITNLAACLGARGQPAEARTLYQRALKLREEALPDNHPLIGDSLNNLAVVAETLSEDKSAEELYLRVLRIREKVPGINSVSYGEAVFNLAGMYGKLDRTVGAEEGYRKAVAVLEKALGENHPRVADALHELAKLLQSQGKTDIARSLFQRERDIATNAFGPDHPAVSRSVRNLALLAWWAGKPKDALEIFDEQRKSARRFFLRELPYLPEIEQRALLSSEYEGTVWSLALSLGREQAKDPESIRRSAEWVLNGKALALEARTLRARLDRESADPVARRLVVDIQELRGREAALALREIGSAAAAVKLQRQALQATRRELERRLSDAGGPATGLFRPWITLDEVRKALPKNDLLVEFVQFQAVQIKTNEKEGFREVPHYAAWVIPPTGSVTILDLGEAGAIDTAVTEARAAIALGAKRSGSVGEATAEKEARDTLQKLAVRILHPLAPHLKNVETLIISPDGGLWLAPWAALPLDKGSYLVEAITPRLVISGRDLMPPIGSKSAASGAALIVANPDFDAAPAAPSLIGRELTGRLGDFDAVFLFGDGGKLTIRLPDGEVIGRGTWTKDGDVVAMETERSKYSGRLSGTKLSGERRLKEMAESAADSFILTIPMSTTADSRIAPPDRIPRASRLPGTDSEGKAAAKALRDVTTRPTKLLTKDAATEAAVKSASRPQVLVLATHAFFLADLDERLVFAAGPIRGGLEPVSLRKRQETRVLGATEPLVRCGLLLAGCNKRTEAMPGQEDGVLTGLEVVGLDLRGTGLVVLSACETAVGEANVGDGVAGLRQAFQLAGADTVVATLWKVPDEETSSLMSRFYSAWADQKNGGAALATAQREAIEARRKSGKSAHPFYWAAFAVTGK